MAAAGHIRLDIRSIQVDALRQVVQKADVEQLDGQATRALLRETLDAIELVSETKKETDE